MIWHSRRGGFPTYHSNDIFFATILLLSHQSWRQTLYLSLSCLVAGVCTCYSSGDLCSWQGKRNHHRRAYWIMRCWDFSNSCHVMQLFSTPLVLFWGFLYGGGLVWSHRALRVRARSTWSLKLLVLLLCDLRKKRLLLLWQFFVLAFNSLLSFAYHMCVCVCLPLTLGGGCA